MMFVRVIIELALVLCRVRYVGADVSMCKRLLSLYDMYAAKRMTAPVAWRADAHKYNCTLDDIECVPDALFYIGLCSLCTRDTFCEQAVCCKYFTTRPMSVVGRYSTAHRNQLFVCC